MSVTRKEVLARAAKQLRAAGVEIPERTAQWIFQHVTGLSTAEVFLQPDEPVADAHVETFAALVARRAKREPLQYVLNEAEFCGAVFWVDGRVLIPRPETELLVRRGRAYLEARMPRESSIAVLDIGTGSGAIAVSLALAARELQRVCACDVRIVASDLSQSALDVARINALRLGVSSMITFVQASYADGAALRTLAPFSLILSNPPYIPQEEAVRLQPEVAQYEPHLALFGGADGLDAYRAIASGCRDLLATAYLVAFEIGIDQADAVVKLGGSAFAGADVEVLRDEQGIERVVLFHADGTHR